MCTACRKFRLNEEMIVGHVSKAKRIPTAAFWMAVSAVTFFCVFVLPFFFPMSEPVYSAAYTVGENNRVAAVAVAVISVLVLVSCVWLDIGKTSNRSASHDRSRLSRKSLLWGVGVVAACACTLGFIVVHHGGYYAEEGYFLTQLRSGIYFHRALYRDIEFPYGPSLYLWPVGFIRALGPLGVSMAAAYVLSVITMECLGVALLFYTINALPMGRAIKVAAFSLLLFGAFDTLLGLNYAILRAVIPFAALAFLTKQLTVRRAVIVACLGEVLLLSISPELGIAFGAGAAAYAIYRKFSSGWKASILWIVPAIAIGGAIFAACLGRDYFVSLHQYANGRDNLILDPQPFMWALLASLVIFAPLAVADGWRERNGSETSKTGLLIAMYAGMLGMLPVAFSQCDPVHAIANGVGAYLLSFVWIDRVARKRQVIWIAVVAITFLATQFQEFHAYRHELARAVEGIPEPYDHADIRALSRAIGNQKVTFPWNRAPLQMMDELTQTGQYLPGYFDGYHGESNAASEVRRIADMRAAEFVLVPNRQALVYPANVDNGAPKRWFRLGYRYKARKQPYYEYAMLLDELEKNWKPVGTYGAYTLYRKIR